MAKTDQQNKPLIYFEKLKKPVKIRRQDGSMLLAKCRAYIDNVKKGLGYGATEAEAIADLLKEKGVRNESILVFLGNNGFDTGGIKSFLQLRDAEKELAMVS